METDEEMEGEDFFSGEEDLQEVKVKGGEDGDDSEDSDIHEIN